MTCAAAHSLFRALAGSNPFLLARHAEGYLASTSSRASNTASHRPERCVCVVCLTLGVCRQSLRVEAVTLLRTACSAARCAVLCCAVVDCRQLHGMSDFSALSRVIPVAVAYREASLQVGQSCWQQHSNHGRSARVSMPSMPCIPHAMHLQAHLTAWCSSTSSNQPGWFWVSNEASTVLAWLQELRQAAEAAVLLTHPSDAVADAAAVLAAAIAWCSR